MKRFSEWLSYTMLGLAIVFFILALLLPTVFSGGLAIVRSSSMEPVMSAGALAMMMPVNPEKVKVGDIITFEPSWDPGVIVSHRVIEVRGDDKLYFVTKGDATEDFDPYLIPPRHVQGKVVFSIPYLGFAASYVLDYIRTWWGFAVFVVVPSVILVGSTIRDVSRSRSIRVRRLKNRQKRRQQWKV